MDALSLDCLVRARYVNNTTPVELICARGHRCAPMPSNVGDGHGSRPEELVVELQAGLKEG